MRAVFKRKHFMTKIVSKEIKKVFIEPCLPYLLTFLEIMLTCLGKKWHGEKFFLSARGKFKKQKQQ